MAMDAALCFFAGGAVIIHLSYHYYCLPVYRAGTAKAETKKTGGEEGRRRVDGEDIGGENYYRVDTGVAKMTASLYPAAVKVPSSSVALLFSGIQLL